MNPTAETTFVPLLPNQANVCRRRAVAEARNLPAENEPKALEAEYNNRRRAAYRLTPLVIEMVNELGWWMVAQTTTRALELASGVVVNVPASRVMYHQDKPQEHYDALIRIPGQGKMVTLNSRGAATTYYDDIAAVARTQQEPRDVVVFAYDSATGELSTHFVRRRSLDEMTEVWSANIMALVEEAKQDTALPEPENEYDAPACRNCRFRASCPAQQEPPTVDEPEMDEDAFAEALDEWLAADERVKELRRYEAIKDSQRDIMMGMMRENGLTLFNFHDDSGQLRIVKIGEQSRSAPNYKALQEALTPAQYKAMVPKNVSHRFTVSKG